MLIETYNMFEFDHHGLFLWHGNGDGNWVGMLKVQKSEYFYLFVQR